MLELAIALAFFGAAVLFLRATRRQMDAASEPKDRSAT
jgi:hypothetical protein